MKKEVIRWAEEMLDKNAVVLDTETTGGSFEDEVIEVSVVSPKDGLVLFDSLFCPKRPISWHSTRVHQLKTKDLKEQPTFPDRWEELRSFIVGVPVLAFNSSFDSRLLSQSCKRYEIEPPETDWHCLLKQCVSFFGKKSGVSLDYTCQELNVQAGNHRALQDALAAARVVWKLSRMKIRDKLYEPEESNTESN